MDKAPSVYPDLSDKTDFRPNKIIEIKDYFIAKILEREVIIKRLSKYIADFDYFNKYLIVLSATSSCHSIALFANVISAPIGIASAFLRFMLS